MSSGGRARALSIAAALVALGAVRGAVAAPKVWIADEGVRVLQGDVGGPLAQGGAIWRPGEPIRVAALRDEVVAFQVIVEADGAPLAGVSVDVAITPPVGAVAPSIERFLEHYVNLNRRSTNSRRPRESLGWSPRARPPDEIALGHVPDALVPVELAAPWCPYPMRIEPRRNGAVWVDVTVPRDAVPGRYRGFVTVAGRDEASGEGAGELARIPIELEVATAVLPYRPVSFLAYYGTRELASRIGDVEQSERQLWQLLHAHHVDPLGNVTSEADADRLRPALDGSLFTQAHGYSGPGEHRPTAAVALGAYGDLGAPTPKALSRVQAIVPRIPREVSDVFLYAVDEDCDSPAGPGWRRLVRGTPGLERVKVAHSCAKDPRPQDVDLVLMPAETFRTRPAIEARAAGKGVWVYNGSMPRAGTMLLDAPLTSLTTSAWIAASHDVGRWFLWETTFWDDNNRGGRGPIDPFVTAESFHNNHGDTAIGDGMLVYPGTQLGRFADHSLGFTGVIPSMRLKSLRRGIQDAGYLALARAANPPEADAIVARLVPAALDEVKETSGVVWPTDGASFAIARRELRALIPGDAVLRPEEAARALAGAAEARRREATAAAWERRLLLGVAAVSALALFAALLLRLRTAAARIPISRRAGLGT